MDSISCVVWHMMWCILRGRVPITAIVDVTCMLDVDRFALCNTAVFIRLSQYLSCFLGISACLMPISSMAAMHSLMRMPPCSSVMRLSCNDATSDITVAFIMLICFVHVLSIFMCMPRYRMALSGGSSVISSPVVGQCSVSVSGVPSLCLPVMCVFPSLSVRLCLFINSAVHLFISCSCSYVSATIAVSSQYPLDDIFGPLSI